MANPNETHALNDLAPATVWNIFSRIAAVPRPSKHEERIRSVVRTIAEEHGLSVREDSTGNLRVDVPATAGYESASELVLQGHLDMVCEKNASTLHDFGQDPIKLVLARDGDADETIVRADGTTLGADNGIGLAMALAAAISPEVVHGPLELLFTIDEESGMTGAKALTPESFRGRRLLNLDSEEDDVLYIGCAGGCDTVLSWQRPAQPIDPGAAPWRVSVSGMQGGHSGSDIHKNRGNAIKLLTHTLPRLGDGGLRLVSLIGGQLRNAIPREAHAVVVGADGPLEVLSAAASEAAAEARRECDNPALSIRVEPARLSAPPVALYAADTATVLAALTALPHGVLAMHPRIDGLVETSNNVATVSTQILGSKEIRIAVATLSRSASNAQLQTTLEQIAAVGRLSGARVATSGEYPGWAPDLSSPLLAISRRVYERLFNAPPKVTAIHAGLECGIIGERVGGVDMISFGPRIEGAHSPEERVYVTSVQKSWQYLTAMLLELAQP